MNRYLFFLLMVLLFSPVVSAQESKNNIDFQAEEARRAAEENSAYRFSVSWRIEGGYIQQWENSPGKSFSDIYYHGGRIGALADLNLPYHLALQTGVQYALAYGINPQHFAAVGTGTQGAQYIEHHILKHTLSVPLRLTYEQKLWRQLAMVFYGGPQFQVGLARQDNMETSLSDATRAWIEQQGLRTSSYEQYGAGDLWRFSFQLGVGGGLQWDRYRLTAGYDFGLNNVARRQTTAQGSFVRDWNWHVSFSYRF